MAEVTAADRAAAQEWLSVPRGLALRDQIESLAAMLATVRADEQKRWSEVITYDRSKYEARVTALEAELRLWGGAHG